jgi:hypothetical protein
VTGEEFFEIYNSEEGLRQYIVRIAKRRNRRKVIQEEFVQEAWLAISCAPAGYDDEYYKKIAYKAIYSSYWQNRKEYLLMQSVNQHVANQACKTPEAPTDNDPWFMQEVQNRDWRD